MKKNLSKILSFCISLTLVLGSAIQSFAMEPEIFTSEVNEYEMYKSDIAKSDEELKEMGMSDDEINELRQLDFNEIFKERAKLSDEILKNMGYSTKQMNILRKYYLDNRAAYNIDNMYNESEDYPTLFSTMSLTASHAGGGTDKRIGVSFTWQWSSLPTYYGGRDILVATWTGTDSNGYPLNVAIDKGSSYHTGYDKNLKTGKIIQKSLGFTTINEYGAAESKFKLGYRIEDLISYYYKGTGKIYVKATGTKNIKEIAMAFGYVHTKVGIGASIDYKGGLSFSPSTTGVKVAGVSNRYNKTKKIS
ncbi:MAG: hypothetical protein ACRCXT_13670 [Paraclostridium sp.]